MAGSVRERNLRGTPWLTLVIAEGDHGAHVIVILEGPGEVVAPAEVPGEVRSAAQGDWVRPGSAEAERLLSYAADSAAL